MFCITIELKPSEEGPFVQLTIDLMTNCGLRHSTTITKTVDEPELVDSVRKIVKDDSSAFELCEQGTGGTYFVKTSAGERIAVFKPVDEEPGSPNNPKNNNRDALLTPGGGAVREVLAYLLDHDRRAGVPETHMLTNLSHPQWMQEDKNLVTKTGSLQKFISHDSCASDMGASLFSVDDVHNIGIFDLRLMNLDRNGENLLVVKEGPKYRLVPIDHSYILPPKISQKPFFEWISWKQAKVPFSASALKYISQIDIEEDARVLASHSISEDSIKTMKICSILLKKCAAAGMNLYQIASLLSSKFGDESEKSELEFMVDASEKISHRNNSIFYKAFEETVDSFLLSCQLKEKEKEK